LVVGAGDVRSVAAAAVVCGAFIDVCAGGRTASSVFAGDVARVTTPAVVDETLIEVETDHLAAVVAAIPIGRVTTAPVVGQTRVSYFGQRVWAGARDHAYDYERNREFRFHVDSYNEGLLCRARSTRLEWKWRLYLGDTGQNAFVQTFFAVGWGGFVHTRKTFHPGTRAC
jgi:hypothetical protein